MSNLKDLSKIIADKGDKPLSISSVNLQSQEDAEIDRGLRQIKSNQELKKEWLLFVLNQIKDIIVFLFALFIILRIDLYAFTILQQDTSSESQIRFAIAALTATISSLLSYLVGRASK